MSKINNVIPGRSREKKGLNSVQKMTKEELAVTLQKKKECNRKALEIVEKMLNDVVQEEWFVNNLLNIRQNHFQDIVEERSILRLCGYPLCSNRLGKVTPHKYHISSKLNKVYDTTERKKFCSNICYKAAAHLENQLLTSPLWFTENSEVPNFSLLPITQTKIKSEGIIGDEIMFFPDNLMYDETTSTSEQSKKSENFISTNQIAAESIIKMHLEPETKGTKGNKKSKDEATKTAVPSESDSGGAELPPPPESAVGIPVAIKTTMKISKTAIDGNAVITHPSVIEFQEQETVPKRKLQTEDANVDNKRRDEHQTVKTRNATSIRKTSHVEACLSEWCTLETQIILLGESKVKQMFREKGKPSAKLNEVLDHRLSNSKFQEQYEKINKRLQLMEIEDMQFDGQLRGTPADDLKPLPSYTELQDVSRRMELKVNAFYEGKTAYIDGGIAIEPEEAVEENLMPLVDNQAHKTLRRKIVLDQLNRVLPNILRICGFNCPEMSRELRSLVNTFSLSAHNISFKPIEWNLLGLVTLNMLALKDEKLKSQLTSKQAERFHTTLLQGFSQDNEYIEKLLESRLLDVDSIWNKIVLDA